MRTLAISLLQGLKDHGAREIFGIPGDFVLPFFKAIEESGILPAFTLSHEPGVGFAADAAARGTAMWVWASMVVDCGRCSRPGLPCLRAAVFAYLFQIAIAHSVVIIRESG